MPGEGGAEKRAAKSAFSAASPMDTVASGDNAFSPTSPGFDHVMGRLERCIKTAANVVIKGFEGFRGGSGDSKPFF